MQRVVGFDWPKTAPPTRSRSGELFTPTSAFLRPHMQRYCLALLVAGASAFAPSPSVRPSLVKPRAASPLALDMPVIDSVGGVLHTTNLLAAQIFGLDTNPYGGVGAFEQSDSGQSGDLNFIILLAVIFPTVVTAVMYKDGTSEG